MRLSHTSTQAWLAALSPALGQLQELGLEDCSLSPARCAGLTPEASIFEGQRRAVCQSTRADALLCS